MKERILKLLKEPSTFAGMAAFLGGAVVLGLDVETWQAIFGAVAAIAGAAAMVMLDPADKS